MDMDTTCVPKLSQQEAHLAKIKTLFQSLGGGGKEEENPFFNS